MARSLRNSEFSLNFDSSKRKRAQSEEEDDEFSDNSPDAQLARAMQEEEDSKISSQFEDVKEFTPPGKMKRAVRAVRAVPPKLGNTSILYDSEDEDEDIMPIVRKKKRATSKLDVGTSRTSRKRPKRSKLALSDSDESEFIVSDSDGFQSDASDSDSADD